MNVNELNETSLAALFDHTFLKAYATKDDFNKLCEEAKSIGAAMVAINSSPVSYCKELLKDTKVHVGAAISFPLGQTPLEVKLMETETAIKQGADEIVFYDITASYEKRGVILDVVREAAKKIFVPLTVGGGIKSIDDFRETLRAGADKVSINSQAVQNPALIREAADIFGCQCVCVGIDAKKIGDHKWTVFINGARVDMHLDLIDWVKQCEQLGAGEICLNSIDADGTKEGFDLPMLKAVCDAVSIPVIASGGAGKLEDFAEAFQETGCSAALAASLFHFGELTVQDVKADCRKKGILMR